MGKRPGICYWLALTAAIGLTAAYVWQRDLPARHDQYRDSARELRDVKEEWRVLQERRETLEEQLQQLEDDPVEWEAVIRRSRNMRREGETIYRVELPGESEE